MLCEPKKTLTVLKAAKPVPWTSSRSPGPADSRLKFYPGEHFKLDFSGVALVIGGGNLVQSGGTGRNGKVAENVPRDEAVNVSIFCVVGIIVVKGHGLNRHKSRCR